MGKEKFVRSKPHVNDEPGENLAAGDPGPPGQSYPLPMTPQVTKMPGPPAPSPEPGHADDLCAPPPVSTGGDRPTESLSLNFEEIKSAPGDGPSTLATLEPEPPSGYGGPDSLAGLGEVEDHAMLLPAVQKIREAAARMESDEPEAELDLEL